MRKILILGTTVFALIFLQNCKSAKSNDYVAKTTLSYTKNIAPILQTSCTPCHFPPGGRKEAFNNYEAVKGHVAEILARVKLDKEDRRFMPPTRSKKTVLDDKLIAVLEKWQKEGMPQ